MMFRHDCRCSVDPRTAGGRFRSPSVLVLLLALQALVAAAASAGSVSDASDAASSGTEGNIDWSISGDTLTLSKNDEQAEGTMDNYSKYSHPAWEDGDGWSGVSRVLISSGVTSIGNNAFRECTGIASVSIPDTVTEIGQEAFLGCIKLGSVTIPDSVTNMLYSVFDGCTSLTTAVIGDSVDNLRSCLFRGCTSLSSVTVGGGVTVVGDLVFMGCTSLTSVTLPSGLTNVGIRVFEGCVKLASIGMEESLGGLYSSVDGVLMGVDAKTHLPTVLVAYPNAKGAVFSVPVGVLSIREYAFSCCTSLEQITFSDSVTSIGQAAFRDCTSLKDVTIGGNMMSLSGMAFCGCTSLEHVTVGGKIKLIGEEAFSGCTALSAVTVEDNVTDIREYAFKGCTSIKSLYVSSALKTVGQGVFEGITFYLDRQEVQPSADVLAGRTWTGGGDGKLYALSSGYTVTFDACGGSCDTPSMKTGTDGKLSSLPAATRDGCTFAGWYTQAEGGDRISTSTVFLGDSTVYAHWDKVPAKNNSTLLIILAVLGVAGIAMAGAAVYLMRRP